MGGKGDIVLLIIPCLKLLCVGYKYINLVLEECGCYINRNRRIAQHQQELQRREEEQQQLQLQQQRLEEERRQNQTPRNEVEVIRIIIVENPNKYFKNDTTEKCPICLDSMNIGEKEQAVASMNCEHTFHRECIIGWLKVSNTCPICRK